MISYLDNKGVNTFYSDLLNYFISTNFVNRKESCIFAFLNRQKLWRINIYCILMNAEIKT